MIYTFSFTWPQSVWTIYRWEEKDNQLLPKGLSHPTFCSEPKSTVKSSLKTQMPNSQTLPKLLAKCGKKQMLTQRIASKTSMQETKNSQSRMKTKEPKETLKVMIGSRKLMNKNHQVGVANLQTKRKLLLQQNCQRPSWQRWKPKQRRERKERKWCQKESKPLLVQGDRVDSIENAFWSYIRS